MEALETLRRGRERGGNRVVSIDRTDNDTRVQAYDQIWVRHIKTALDGESFSTGAAAHCRAGGGDRKIYDVAIRMLDTTGKEVLPSEFLPAAARNDLLKNIDRWVIGASLSFVSKQKPDLSFVRVSRDSAMDAALPQWLEMQLKATLAEPQRLCLQVTEEIAIRHPEQVLALATSMRARGMKFALEHFGSSEESKQLIDFLPLDFIKIDGALMQG
jgi:EAL domain-containing protein (putative c-di-GMP-specific phosphodiesterase class I)